jgi:hypothetical protein
MTSQHDDELVDALRAQFPAFQNAPPEVITSLLGSKTVAPWYKQWKEQRAIDKALPDAFADAGFTGDIWKWATNIRTQRSTVRKTHADTTQRLAREHKQKVDLADASLHSGLAATDSPLMDLIEAGFEQLPLASQVAVSSAVDNTTRERLLGEHLATFRRTGLHALYPEGVEAFRPGIGPSSAGA